MSGNHTHSHDHSHHHHQANKKALLISFILIAAFMITELIGGLLTNSLALLSDAGHMLSDAFSLGLSLFAFKFGEKIADESRTYGYKRFEILAALLNGVLLVLISIFILWEAYQRFFHPPEVVGSGMLVIAIIGMLVNIVVAWILMKGDTSENLNLRSAFMHVLGDLLGSVGAVIAALLILFFGWNYADPIASVLVSVLILLSGYRITKDAVHVLMEGKPEGVDIEAIKHRLLDLADVEDVHDLHIWSITSDFPSLSCHLVVRTGCHRDDLLYEVTQILTKEFQLEHTTIQIEGEALNLQHYEDQCN